MIILISIYIIALEGVFSLIAVLFSSFIKLLILYNNRDDLEFEITKIIKIGALPMIDLNTYNLPI